MAFLASSQVMLRLWVWRITSQYSRGHLFNHSAPLSALMFRFFDKFLMEIITCSVYMAVYSLYSVIVKENQRLLTWLYQYEKEDFSANNIPRDKGHFIIMTGFIFQEDTILSICAPNNRTSKYRRQKLIDLQGENRKIYEHSSIFQHLLSNN